MVGWHHRLNGHEFEQTQGDSEERGSLECCSSWGHKDSDMTQQLNNDNDNSKLRAPFTDLKSLENLEMQLIHFGENAKFMR